MLCEVFVDYGQFQLNGVRLADLGVAHGLMIPTPHDYVGLVVFREYGMLPVEAHVLDAEPPLRGAEWTDVVEFSVTAVEDASVGGWADTGDDFPLPLVPGRTYRVRYSIANGDRSDGITGPPYPESYCVELWPSPLSAPGVRVSLSDRGRAWHTHPVSAISPESAATG